MARRTAPDFGIGLDNINAAAAKSVQPVSVSGAQLATIHASMIRPSPFNEGLDPGDLEAYRLSMDNSGLIEPITVYKLPGGSDTGYEIVSGHQRFEVWCHMLGHPTINAFILPYEENPVKRFRAHSEANILHRDKNINFWTSRIKHAKDVLAQSGFTGSKAELMNLVSDLLGGISVQQLYRFESFEKLAPELQELEKLHVLSASTLYSAVKLTIEQQREVRKRVDELLAVKKRSIGDGSDDAEITRDEFKRIVAGVRDGVTAKAKTPPSPSTYSSRADKAVTSVIGTLSRCKTQEDRDTARKKIAELRLMLDELESSLGPDVMQ